MGRKRAAEVADASQHTQQQPSAQDAVAAADRQVKARGLARGDLGLEDASAAKSTATGAAAEQQTGTAKPSVPQPSMKKR
jgi:hypothetical protein